MSRTLLQRIGVACLAGAATMTVVATSHADGGAADRAPGDRAQSELTELYARSATYFDPARAGEGIVVELLSEGRALVYLFSYGAAGTAGAGPGQSWMIGVGQQVEGGVVVDELLMPTGGRFGQDFHANEIAYPSFASLHFEYPTCGTSATRGRLVVTPHPGTGFEPLVSENYVQLTRIADCDTGATSSFAYNSGSWYDPEREGEGLILHFLEDERVLLLWLTYDDAGNQMWIEGVGQLSQYRFLTIQESNSYSGTSWGPSFDPRDVVASPFGKLVIEFSRPNNCTTVTIDYQNSRFGAGSRYFERFTELLGVSDYPIDCWGY